MAVEQALDVEEFQLSPLVDALAQTPQDAAALAAVIALLTRLEGQLATPLISLRSYISP